MYIVEDLGAGEVPPDIRELADRSGLRLDDLGDIVRSVTYRAHKR